MTDKLSTYDVLGIVIPGVLLLAWVPICFPGAAEWAQMVRFPTAFSALALTALAVFVGQIIQALASLLEPVLYWTWRGRPSDRALSQGLKGYLPPDSAERINEKLCRDLPPKSDPHSRFLYAMQQAATADNPRVAQFNTLYAYHRALLVLTVLGGLALIASMFWGSFAAWTAAQRAAAIVSSLLLALLIWYRAWQRACYYVREVLLTAERALDSRESAKE